MKQETSYVMSQPKMEICTVCGSKLGHQAYLDHLFSNKDCMRKYWEDEEKNHISRLRQRTARANPKMVGASLNDSQ